MTDPIDASYQLEAKKDGLKQVQSGDVKLTLTIQAIDMPNELYSDPMGQRYVIVMVPIGDNEEPIAKPKSFAQQAKLMAKDEFFQDFVEQTKGYIVAYGIDMQENREKSAEEYIERTCGVKSCSELIEGTEAGNKFKTLQREYGIWRG